MSKRLLLINSVCGIRSTGRICADIANEYEAKGWQVRIGYGRVDFVPEDCKRWAVKIGTTLEMKVHGLITRIFDRHATGVCSYFATKKFLKWADEYDPDELWLHNLHGYYLNVELLFKWIKSRPNMKVRWTLHSCWPFTGHCSHFTSVNCTRWEAGCYDCPQKSSYPASKVFDNARNNWWMKRSVFCGVKDMSLITPCQWLADITRRSFLKEYPVEVVKNRVDLSEFKRVRSDFRTQNGIQDKKVILGVSLPWTKRKGLNDFLRLRDLLEEEYVIVLVGVSKEQNRCLPRGIVGIEKTNSRKALAEIYSAADWFFNPTQEDTFPTVNLEARACGCKIVTYDTGGCAETVEGYDKAIVLYGADKSPEGFVRVISPSAQLLVS